MIDLDFLKSILSYDPITGNWTWLRKDRGHRNKDGFAGTITEHGYRAINIGGKPHYAHILSWFYMTGVWPVLDVDHKNRNKLDNRWDNLRLATVSQNHVNKKKRIDNTTGEVGVQIRPSGKWYAEIWYHKKKYYLGSFDTKPEAAAAYKKARYEFYGEFSPE